VVSSTSRHFFTFVGVA
jgi:hypothetical protein